MRATTDYAELIKLIQAARGLEAGGYYGLAKLMWALAYAAEIKTSNAAGIPRGAQLDATLADILESLKGDAVDVNVTFTIR